MIDKFLDAFDAFEQHGLAPFGTSSADGRDIRHTDRLFLRAARRASSSFDDDGALLLNVGGETRRYLAGEVSLRGEHGYV